MKGRKGNKPGPTAPASNPPSTTANPPISSPTSPTSKATAKYTNKDGSKFITVPKGLTPASAASPAAASTPSLSTHKPSATESSSPVINAEDEQPTVNRKKAKRRAKAAAKAQEAQAEQEVLDQYKQGVEQLRPTKNDIIAEIRRNAPEGEFMSMRDPRLWEDTGFEPDAGDGDGDKKNKKKKKKKGNANNSVTQAADGEIWDMDSQQERERIKEFWMSLSEADRKDLVKVEKDAVLKKMKEQQKHQCSCTVCGRKRTAIEEELEGLYDAYYEELEQYAHDPNHQPSGPPMLGSQHPYASARPRGPPAGYPQQPSRGRIVEQLGDDEQDDGEEYSDDDEQDELDDDEDDEYSGDDEEELPADETPRDDYFFSFGNSLTVKGRNMDIHEPPAHSAQARAYANLYSICKQFEDSLSTVPLPSPDSIKRLIADVDSSLGGILTVADDLLKNDGKKFIEMMERLAERRMNREENLRDQYAHGPDYHGATNGHSHPHPPSEEDEFGPEDEEDEDYTSQEDEFDDEEDTMTDEQRMEEGRKMFQIFAARMFEQRVLHAYRKKRSKERQDALVKQIESEEALEAQRKEAKAKAAQKKKEKAAQKKQAAAEEKARKEAEKLAEAEKRRAEEAEKAEGQRLAAEEKRKKKEAQKKAEEEERHRKEAERLKRIQEQKERQAEQERKAREAKEREKKAREEAKLKETEARERKEKESRERREKQEQDKRDKEARAKANEAKAKQKRDEKAAQKAAAGAPVVVPITLAKRPSQHANTAVPVVPQPPVFGSPQIPIAAAVLPKAPTPMRPRQISQQGPSSGASRSASQQSGSGASQIPSPIAATPAHASPGPIGAPRTASLSQPAANQAHATSPLAALLRPAMHQASPFMMPSVAMPFSNSMSPVGVHGGFNAGPGYPPLSGGSYRPPGPPGPPGPPSMMQMPPGMNGPARGFPGVAPPPGLPQPSPEQLAALAQFNNSMPQDGSPAEASRQPSGGFDHTSPNPAAQPIARPAPIGRPSSVVHGQRPNAASPAPEPASEQDDGRLGSKALLDDSESAFDNYTQRPTPTTRPAFPPPGLGGGFGMDPFVSQSRIWNNPVMAGFPNSHAPPPGHFPMASPMSSGTWGPPQPGPGLFPSHGSIGRSAVPRPVKIRQILCRVCKDMDAKAAPANPSSNEDPHKFWPINAIKEQTEMLLGTPLQDAELDSLYDTEGNSTNGGGLFEIGKDKDGSPSTMRWVPGASPMESLLRQIGGGMNSLGEVGSPVIGSAEGNGWGGSHRG